MEIVAVAVNVYMYICAIFLFPNVHDVLEHWIDIYEGQKVQMI